MSYETWNRYDLHPSDTPQDIAHRQQRLRRDQQTVRAMLLHLRQEIESPHRDFNSVSGV